MKSGQIWVVVLALCATFFLIQARGDTDPVPQSAPLAQLPTTLGAWSSQDIPISSEALQILGKGEFLNRVYTRGSLAGQPGAPLATEATPSAAASAVPVMPVQLFIAYFPTQRSGQSIHSPQNCLPGSGWTFLHSGTTQFTDHAGKTYDVGDYLISDGKDKQEVLYWYQSHGRSIANDYKAKLLMLTDAIRTGRTDAALVRLITAVGPSEEPSAAHARLIRFAQNVTPLLPAYIPN